MMMTATARPIDGTLRHEIDVNRRHVITTDEPERLGGSDTAAAPHELLPAMLAACASTMIMLYAQGRDWKLEDLSVEVLYDPESTPRNVKIMVHLPEPLPAAQLQRLRRVVDTCPAKRALEAGFAFEEELVLATGSHVPAGPR